MAWLNDVKSFFYIMVICVNLSIPSFAVDVLVF